MLNLPGRPGCYPCLHIAPLPRQSLHMCIAGTIPCFARTHQCPTQEWLRVQPSTKDHSDFRAALGATYALPSVRVGSAHAVTGGRTLVGRIFCRRPWYSPVVVDNVYCGGCFATQGASSAQWRTTMHQHASHQGTASNPVASSNL